MPSSCGPTTEPLPSIWWQPAQCLVKTAWPFPIGHGCGEECSPFEDQLVERLAHRRQLGGERRSSLVEGLGLERAELGADIRS
jgi:hypothetical protein